MGLQATTRAMLVLCASVAGCYSPDVGGEHGARYICSAASPICPDGQSCDTAAQCCLSPGETPQSDRTGSCQIASSDMGGLPARCSLLDPTGTVSNIIKCRGAFAGGGASALCPTGWRINDTAMPPALQAACGAVSGFFASGFSLWVNPSSALSGGSCTQVAPYTSPGLSGCGSEAGATNATSCAGWPRAVVCARSQTFMCPGGDLGKASNSDMNNGIICVR